MEGEFKHFGRQRTQEELQGQFRDINAERNKQGLDFYYANPEDFTLSEKELKEKYGGQYEEYKNDLKLIIRKKIMSATSEEEIFSTAKELLPEEKFETFKQEIEDDKMEKKEFPVRKRRALKILTAYIVFSGIGLGGMEFIGRQAHRQKISVGKNNPILAAQSKSGMVFKDDNGIDLMIVDKETGNKENKRYGNIEQVIAHPASINKEDETKKEELQRRYLKKEISFDEYKEKFWELEARKKQGFLDAYNKEIITFEELAGRIKENGEKGIKTALHFGDSSTSGWNSNILTENTLEIVRTVFPELRKYDPNLPETFENYVRQKRPSEYNSQDYKLALSLEAERLKEHPHFTEVWNRNYDKIRKEIKSPFMTYDTYSDVLARVDKSHYHVNLGVPGHSAVHGVAYVKRMIDEFRNAGVARYIDSATIYFGNNDSVYNGNAEDKFYIGDDIKKQFHAAGLIKETYPQFFSATRVNLQDFGEHLEKMISELRENGVKNITLFVPVIPYDWTPGQRAVNDAQEIITKQYAKGGKASKLFKKAKGLYADYVYERGIISSGKERNYKKAAGFAKQAIENDIMVPRRKENYVRKIAEVAKNSGVNLVNIEQILPIQDMSQQNADAKNPHNITNDYCHPSEHSNILLAVGEAVTLLDKENVEKVKKNALEYLLSLGFNENLAKKEIETVVNSCVAKKSDIQEKYDKLSLNERRRTTWNDNNF